jgi:F-type H+-transporting ATPase subunit epsilon
MSAQDLEFFKLRIITPEKEVFSGEVEKISLESASGAIEVYPAHEPLLSPLKIGLMSIREKGAEEDTLLALHGGFLEVGLDETIIMADAAEAGREVNLERAQQAQERAKERLESKTDQDIDRDRAHESLMRSITRINAMEGKFM